MLKHCLIVFGVSMVPLIELRGAIPYGIAFGLPLWQTYCIAIVGNMLPVPIIYFFARKVLAWGCDKRYIGKFFTWCLQKGERGGQKLQEKAGRGLFWALLLFVGIPITRREMPCRFPLQPPSTRTSRMMPSCSCTVIFRAQTPRG